MAELRKAVALAPAEIKAARLNLALARQALARVKERLRIKGEQHKALLADKGKSAALARVQSKEIKRIALLDRTQQTAVHAADRYWRPRPPPTCPRPLPGGRAPVRRPHGRRASPRAVESEEQIVTHASRPACPARPAPPAPPARSGGGAYRGARAQARGGAGGCRAARAALGGDARAGGRTVGQRGDGGNQGGERVCAGGGVVRRGAALAPAARLLPRGGLGDAPRAPAYGRQERHPPVSPTPRLSRARPAARDAAHFGRSFDRDPSRTNEEELYRSPSPPPPPCRRRRRQRGTARSWA
jgi:hypothetical protein